MILESHFHLSYVQYASIMLLCLLGIILNLAMLIIFVTKKQVRGSVYTTYMIQIAVTDLLVCVIWLVMSPVFIMEIQNHLKTINQGESSTTIMDLEELNALVEDVTGTSNFIFYRTTFAVYYLHYYFNIFLLATMSVERCVAVWKSLRCQRYQFNRKFIIIVSVVMGLAALACALPTFWDQELLTSDLRNSTHSNDFSEKETDFELYQRCFLPLSFARKHNHTFVMDQGDISVNNCVNKLTNLSIGYLDENNALDYFEDDNDLFAAEEKELFSDLDTAFTGEMDVDDLFGGYGEYDDLYKTEEYEDVNIMEKVEWPPGSGSYIEAADRMLYHHLLQFALNAFPVEYDMKAMCDPALTKEARIYQIIVHMVIGFFIPFTAIVVSYVSIAYMIGKRARERLEPEAGVELNVGRRMSDFLKQFVSGGSNFKTEGDRTPPYHCGSSPLLKRSLRQKRKKLEESTNLVATEANSEAKSVPEERANLSRDYMQTNGHQSTSAVKTMRGDDKGLTETSTPYSPAKTSHVRPRLSSAGVDMRRTSGGSASSAESFQTDQTSIHTSPSPGVRLSAPTFMNSDKVLVKRACSAESSASTSTTTTTQGNPHPRWSNDVFRSNSVDEELKRQHGGGENNQHGEFESPYEATDSNSHKRSSGTPTRVHKQSVSDSTQDLWHGSHSRLHTQKSDTKRPFHRQISTTSNYYRSRAYSAQSRGSTGTGTMRKTIVHKHAERHMRVSRTVLTYILVFAICWLPQRIVHTLYITESWVGRSGYFCHAMTASTRILTFFSVLLNPIVYAVTQREILQYLRQKGRDIFTCGRGKGGKRTATRQTNGFAGNENQDFSRAAEHNVTSEEVSKRERHLRNRELWSRMVNRLGRKSMVTASGVSINGEKKSDGTIDEEREEEKGQSSKGQSSSTSLKLISNWEDWQQLIDDMSGNKNDTNPPINETIL